MKKIFRSFLIALFLAFVFTGCVRAPSTAPANQAAVSTSQESTQAPASASPAAAETLQTSPPEASPSVYGAIPASPAPFTLSSSAFSPDGEIPASYSCNGEDISPPLAWGEPPSGTQSFALIVDDPDAGGFTHWLLYNLPASTRSLPENLPKQVELPGGGMQGVNDFGKPGYGGPCPPRGTHHYVFQLYALDGTLSLPAQPKKADVLSAMEGHILAQASLTGLYTHR